jgi:hypothetical protein
MTFLSSKQTIINICEVNIFFGDMELDAEVDTGTPVLGRGSPQQVKSIQ